MIVSLLLALNLVKGTFIRFDDKKNATSTSDKMDMTNDKISYKNPGEKILKNNYIIK